MTSMKSKLAQNPTQPYSAELGFSVSVLSTHLQLSTALVTYKQMLPGLLAMN